MDKVLTASSTIFSIQDILLHDECVCQTQTIASVLDEHIQSMVTAGSSTSYDAHHLTEDMLSQVLIEAYVS